MLICNKLNTIRMFIFYIIYSRLSILKIKLELKKITFVCSFIFVPMSSKFPSTPGNIDNLRGLELITNVNC